MSGPELRPAAPPEASDPAPVDPPAAAGIADPDSDEAEPTTPRGRRLRIALAVVAALALVAFLAVSSGILPPGGADMPAAGELWFGSRYDPASLVLEQSWTTSSEGRPVAVVAHLVRPSSPRLSVAMTLDGSPVVATTIDVASGHDFVGLAPTSILGRIAGRWVVTISDATGTLASGTLTVTP